MVLLGMGGECGRTMNILMMMMMIMISITHLQQKEKYILLDSYKISLSVNNINFMAYV